MNRRELLVRGGLGLAGAAVGSIARPAASPAQAPKRGGTVTIRAWDPPHLDPYKAGPSVTPGTFPIEGDLAESWSQPNDTTYVFNDYGGRLLQAWLDR